MAVGAAETEAFWTEFIRSLVARGLPASGLVISNGHPRLKSLASSSSAASSR
jgi:putative transposase